MLEELQREAERLEIAEHVTFPGFLEQSALCKLYQWAHVFAHPSEMGPDGNQEGVPNSMLEAMASGLPTIATIHGGIPEAIEDGRSGLLIHEKDHDALATGILHLLQNDAQRHAIAAAGSQAVHKKFDLQRQLTRLEEIYEEAIQLHRERKPTA
jgi:glycosyltransferase involved in cell wall biosynthesis